MAMNKYGRFSPKTTDPKTGARIADPDVEGMKLPNDVGTVTNWPAVREQFKRGYWNNQLFGKGGNIKKPTGGQWESLDPAVKNYLLGKTDKLDDNTYEEPIISKDYDEMGKGNKVSNLMMNYKTGSAPWNKAVKKLMSAEKNPNSVKTGQTISQRQKELEGGLYNFQLSAQSTEGGFGLGEYIDLNKIRANKKKGGGGSTVETEDPTPPTPTPPKPKKPIEEVETKNVGVTDYSYEAPSKSYKTTKTVLDTKITKKEKTVPALRKVEVQPIHGAKVKGEGRYYREKKLAETYMSGEYGGESFRGKTKEEMKGILQKARQDKRASMEAGEWSEAKYGVKQARQAKRYAGRENVTGVTSSPEMVTPKTQVQEKYYTGNLKDEQGNIVGQSKKGARPKMNEEGVNYWTKALDGDKKMPSGYNVLSTSDQKQSKNKYYTASNLKGYSGSYEDISKKETFRNQRENAANRNTIFGQLATLNNKMRERVGAKPIQRATKRSEKITE
jgi:hypothetical protein